MVIIYPFWNLYEVQLSGPKIHHLHQIDHINGICLKDGQNSPFYHYHADLMM
jgi:hypothetical protein